jgi:pyruvate dehydrogenase E2 component (dihydrolipoamide acetyltransferase)
MSIEITMPKLSDTMEEGTILRWFKRVGDRVDQGEVVAEVETDKADMELEAERAGTVMEIRVPEGAAAAVGAVLAVLGESPEAAAGTEPARAEPPAAPVSPAPEAASGTAALPPRPATVPPRSTVPPPARPTAPAPHAAGRAEQSKLRLTVAKQMVASKREMPHFYVTSEIDMGDAARVRDSLNAAGPPERITFTHLIIRALALTLQRHPRVNASWGEERVVFHDDVNIGVAVAVEDGLIAPVLRGCQRLSLREIARATADLVQHAQSGKFTGDVLTGGTFTVSNMGMLDIEDFSAVIIPPQAAILAVGAIKERPVVREGQLTVARTMRVTMSADHRVLNGMEAGRFLEDLKRGLENPVWLVAEVV